MSSLRLFVAPLLCGIAGAAVPVQAATTPLYLRNIVPTAKQAGTVFVSDANGGDVQYFADTKPFSYDGILNGSPLSAPFGMAVDNQNDLYICNWIAGSSNTSILVYKNGAASPSETLVDTGAAAYAVAVGNDGTVYLANFFTSPGGSKQEPGNVLVYPPGQTTPSTTLMDSGFGYVTGVAVDAQNNVFVSFNTGLQLTQPPVKGNNAGMVAEFAGGSGPAKILFDVPGPKGNSGVDNLALDKSGNVVVIAYYSDGLYVYPPGATQPSRSFGLDKNGIEQQLAFDASGKYVFVPVLYENKVDVFDYKSGKLVTRISSPSGFASVSGVAVAPRLPLP